MMSQFNIPVPGLGKTEHSAKNGLPKHLEKKPNSFYYLKNGNFNVDAAKSAYAELFQFHGYSLADAVLNEIPNSSLCGDKLWILDFNLGDFSNVGMAGVFFVNDKEHRYFAHEIYLLPYQMIPQHAHVESEGLPAKHEAWHVRHGDVWTFAKGGTEVDLCKYPPDVAESLQSQLKAKSIQCFKGKHLQTGEMDALSSLVEPHFMIAGAQGAIVSEYASYHSFDGLVLSNPNGKLQNTTIQ